MDTQPEDKQVVELLVKLKHSSGAYPQDMLNSRRQQFMRQVANAGLGIGVGTGLRNAAKQSQGAGAGVTATVTGKIIETVLIAAITIEAGTTAYIYRNKIADFFKTFTGSPDTSETIQHLNNNSNSSEPVILPTLTPPATSSTPSTATTSLFDTPAPGVQLNNTNNNNNSSTGSNTTNIHATPVPTDRNGHHYGQTPRP